MLVSPSADGHRPPLRGSIVTPPSSTVCYRWGPRLFDQVIASVEVVHLEARNLRSFNAYG